MGKGVAIIPTDNIILSPFDGKVLTIAKSKHALGLVSNHGIEILIHIGLDTFELNGEGFEILIKEDQKIKQGQELMRIDLDF